MLTWARIFLLVAVVAGLFGFTNIATRASLARFCFALFFFCLPALTAMRLATV